MYGAFANSKFLGGGANRRPILYDVLSERDGPFLNVSLQMQHSPPCVVPSYADIRRDMREQPAGPVIFGAFCRVPFAYGTILCYNT